MPFSRKGLCRNGGPDPQAVASQSSLSSTTEMEPQECVSLHHFLLTLVLALWLPPAYLLCISFCHRPSFCLFPHFLSHGLPLTLWLSLKSCVTNSLLKKPYTPRTFLIAQSGDWPLNMV